VLTALAPVMLIGWIGTGGFFEPFVLLGVALLWSQPTRDWYAGRDWQARYRARQPEQRRPAERQDPFVAPPVRMPPRHDQPTGDQPPADQPPGRAPAPGAQPPQAQPLPPAWATASYAPLPSGERPTALVAACVVAWVGIGLAAVGLLIALVWLASSASDGPLNDALQQTKDRFGTMADGVTLSQVRIEMYVVVGLLLLWCLVAAVVTVFALLGRRWARILLATSAVVAGVLCAIGAVLGALPLLVLAVGCVVTLRLLLRPDVVLWRR